MHMLKPPITMFTPRMLAGVLSGKKPAQPTQQDSLGLPTQLEEVEERVEEREVVVASPRWQQRDAG
jgi:hypothetical protein